MNTLLTKTFLTGAAVAALATLALPSIISAGEVHNRVENQRARIQQGVASGQLTQREYNRDTNRLNAINAQRKADLKANDGHLTGAEHAQLNHELNGSSRQIYFTKHNLAHQPGA